MSKRNDHVRSLLRLRANGSEIQVIHRSGGSLIMHPETQQTRHNVVTIEYSAGGSLHLHDGPA
jgi:hypothetical protein